MQLTVELHFIYRIATVCQYEEAVGVRIPLLALVQNDQRTVQAAALLTRLVGVVVIDESSSARRLHVSDERIARLYQRRGPLRVAAEAVDAVVIALDLQAMPMHGCRRLQLIDDCNRDRLILREYDRRSGNVHLTLVVHLVAEGRTVFAGNRIVLLDTHANVATWRLLFRDWSVNHRAHHESTHADHVMRVVVRRFHFAERRMIHDVEREMTVEQPIAGVD